MFSVKCRKYFLRGEGRELNDLVRFGISENALKSLKYWGFRAYSAIFRLDGNSASKKGRISKVWYLF